jgi:hypothetical protein
MENKLTAEGAIDVLKRHSLNTEACTESVIKALTMAIEALQSQPPTVTGYTDEDMIGFAEWCRNGLLNSEYSIENINKILKDWMRNKLTPNK